MSRAIMAISVGQELRQRIQEHPEVNWSEVAREAFEGRLVEMENMEGSKVSKDAVARLVASRARAQNEERTLGFESGKRWAEQDAEWAELRDLAAESAKGDDARDIIHTLYSNELTNAEIVDWLERQLDERYSDDMLDGFIEGAVAVYDAL